MTWEDRIAIGITAGCTLAFIWFLVQIVSGA